MRVYYNEFDQFAAAWLRELMKAKVIPDGEVDTRSIVDVRPDDLREFGQCHFFAGIGGWAYALRLAGWPDDRDVWTGSCPCQPWSMAGQGKGADDSRHLWPAWFPLIEQRRPASLFGEQVASKDGEYWLDLVLADMERIDYAIGTVDLPAASVGSPNRRQRFWFVADANEAGRTELESSRLLRAQQHYASGRGEDGSVADASRQRVRTGRSGETQRAAQASQAGDRERQRVRPDARQRGATSELENADSRPRTEGKRSASRQTEGAHARLAGSSSSHLGVALGDPKCKGLEGHTGHVDDGHEPGWFGADAPRPTATAGPTNGFWFPADWLPCSDGKARPVEPGTFPLAHGIPARVGRLRGYGNAINPEVARQVIEAYMEIRGFK